MSNDTPPASYWQEQEQPRDVLYVEFSNAQTGEVGPRFGPFPFVQVTYDTIRVGKDGERFLATLGSVPDADGVWVLSGESRWWTDVAIFPA